MVIRVMFYKSCFALDGTTLAFGAYDLYPFMGCKTGQQIVKLDGHSYYVNSISFSPDGLHQHLVVEIGLSVYGMLRQDNKKQNQKSVSLLMVVYQHPVVEITISVYGMLRSDNKLKLNSHTNMVNTVCFSPDGTTLLSGSGDKSNSLWEVKPGQYSNKSTSKKQLQQIIKLPQIPIQKPKEVQS
ncbi:unnamed protein product [Paramecium octaurelia]|uniref:Uncharacterized protein n=1 Tax=Paramecium octaurelia TaxID=43137 RepID=A0A8S1VRA3_PAROT|nr:unnamed protein product [Paramecium octaurelia]